MERIKKVSVTIEIPEAMHEWLLAHCKAYNVVKHEVVRRAVTRYLFELKRIDRKRAVVPKKTKAKPRVKR